MNTSQLKWAAAVLGIVLILWGISEALSERPDDRETARVIPLLTAEQVDRVTITSPDDTLALARAGDAWTVNGLPASGEEVTRLFAGLADSTPGELAATSPAVHARMGVDESGSRFTFLHGADTLGSVIFGNRGKTRSSYLVRRVGNDAVYLYSGPLAAVAGHGLDDWRDKIIVDAAGPSVGRLEVSRGHQRYVLEADSTGWRLAGRQSAPADSGTVARLLARFHPLKANTFPTAAQLDSADFSRPDRRLTLLGTSGDTIAALVFDSTATGYWVRRAGGGTVYGMNKWEADQIMPSKSGLVASPGGAGRP